MINKGYIGVLKGLGFRDRVWERVFFFGLGLIWLRGMNGFPISWS